MPQHSKQESKPSDKVTENGSKLKSVKTEDAPLPDSGGLADKTVDMEEARSQ